MSDLKERYEKEIKRLDQQLKEEVESKKNMGYELRFEIWKLKKRNENLEKEYSELRQRSKEKDEELLHYANCLKKQESEHRDALTSKQKEIEECHKRLKKQESEHRDALTSKQKEIEECHKRLKKLESEHRDALTSKQKEIEECHKRHQQDLKYYLSRLSQEECQSKKLREDRNNHIASYKLLQEDFSSYTKDKEKQADQMKNELSTKDDELRRLHKDLKDVKTRLSSIYERRLKRDQRRVENALEFNTPSDVEKDFSEFLEGHRIDAWDVIETTLSLTEENDVQIRYLACMIFVAAYEQVQEAQEALYDFFNNIIESLIDEAPRRSQELCIKRKDDSCSLHFPITFEVSMERNDNEDFTDIVDGLMLSLKQTAHLCDLACFENDVKQLILGRWAKCLQEKTEMPLLPALSEDVMTQLNDYIRACIRLAWKMVTQIPPLQLEYSSSKFNETVHRLTRLHCSHDSAEPEQSENIACYLWPTLMEHGGRVIFHGEVLCKSVVS